MSGLEQYSRYFPVGAKVGVGIPLPNADVFKDWAIIHDIDEDLVSLQLSRDVLPVEVTLHYGQILELRGGNKENGYCCRAIVVSEDDTRELLLRLIGEIVSDELREFYRVDAFLPIKYYVSHEQHIDVLHTQWEERRIHRQLLEIDRKDHRWNSSVLPARARLPHERLRNPSQTDRDEAAPENQDPWDSIIPLAANISGGGVRLITHQGFEDGEYTLLEILVPSPKRVIDVIGRIVFANRNYSAGSDSEYYNTGVQFVYIDERDRDAIVTYISSIQLKRIQQLREKYLFRGTLENDSAQGSQRQITPVVIVSFIVFAVVLAVLINYFWYYAHEHPKGEIQRTFEDAVRHYREQQK